MPDREGSTMAPKNIHDSKHWRDRATEMRALADGMSETKPAQLLNDLADDYDRLADRAEIRARDLPDAPLNE
jgi:hypothetical protein